VSRQLAYLPRADVRDPLTEGPLKREAQFEGIAADLDEVVDESTDRRHGERRREENHVTQLDKHF
jgi:hypothetical protein